MVKAVFIQNKNSDYDDLPGHAYHFPKIYLKRAARTVGDWIILYESSKNGGRGSYFAIHKVNKIIPDPTKADHYYALYEKGAASGFSFVQDVPIKDPSGEYYEGVSPAWQSAVRHISDHAFDRIWQAGTASQNDGFALPREKEGMLGFSEDRQEFQFESREQVLTSRKYRDPKFREAVVRAYGGRCAISGLELRNGGGRAEVQAAHIKPVEAEGPDLIQNGLALSGTIHWMFDRKLISVDDDYSILVAKDSIADETLKRLMGDNEKLILPKDSHLAPHQGFLKWHRENIFQG